MTATKTHDSGSTQKNTLVILWFASFTFVLSVTLYLYLSAWIESDNAFLMLRQLNELYAPYLSAITLFYWGVRSRGQVTSHARAKMSFILALVASVLWNGVIVVLLIAPLVAGGAIEDALENMRVGAGLLSWLAGGAIGFYFATPTAEEA